MLKADEFSRGGFSEKSSPDDIPVHTQYFSLLNSISGAEGDKIDGDDESTTSMVLLRSFALWMVRTNPRPKIPHRNSL